MLQARLAVATTTCTWGTTTTTGRGGLFEAPLPCFRDARRANRRHADESRVRRSSQLLALQRRGQHKQREKSPLLLSLT